MYCEFTPCVSLVLLWLDELMKYKKINLNNVLRQEEVGEREEADEAPGRPESADPLEQN